jgi:C-terminal processing protease CtpA/Prc
MTKPGILCLLFVFLLSSAGDFVAHADTRPAPDFNEVYDLVRQHLAGSSPAELNNAALQGLLTTLGPKVSLVDTEDRETNQQPVLVSKTSLFDGPIGYIRIHRVAGGLDKAVRQACQDLGSSNKLAGLIIDLRFAGGSDYSAAVAVADLFASKEQPLLDWGQGMVRSRPNPDNIHLPLAVLVNQKTSAAAEALAAVLRETGASLVLGARTAGHAMIAQEYPLKNGERLRIATSPIQLGDGTNLSSDGTKPDIAIRVPEVDERAYYSDPFKELVSPNVAAGPGATNGVAAASRARRPRFNEAELVRERRDGLAPDSELAANAGSEGEKPVVHDPVLARALDFLKGLSVMRQTRS